MSDQGSNGAAKAAPARYSSAYASVVVGLLLLAYTFNFIDRTIVATIGQAIKVDLKLTDTQLGLLGGFSFAVLYTLGGIPIARLAERYNRVSIIAVSLVVWSGFTALCGAAQSFTQLLLLRVGVGVGEAGCSPPSHSLISDYFSPKARTTALSVYSFGIPLGTMFGAIAGGWLAQSLGWRWAFVVVGLPGLLIALLVKLAIKEPPRGHSETLETPVLAEDVGAHAVEAQKGFWLWTELKELAAVSRVLFLRWPVANMVAGVTIASFGSYGSGQFAPPLFARAFHLDYATIGFIVGLIAGFSAGIGTLLGGVLTDSLGKRHARWYPLIPAIGLAIATPIYVFAYLQTDWKLVAAILLIPGIFHYTYLGPTFGVVQNSVDARRRATATALLFFVLNFIALGGGPFFTGWIIDRFAEFNFNHQGLDFMGSFKAMLAGGPQGEQHFAAACPGGKAPAGAAVALKQACGGALVLSTRQGVIVSILFYGWAAVHYLLAALSMGKSVRRDA